MTFTPPFAMSSNHIRAKAPPSRLRRAGAHQIRAQREFFAPLSAALPPATQKRRDGMEGHSSNYAGANGACRLKINYFYPPTRVQPPA